MAVMLPMAAANSSTEMVAVVVTVGAVVTVVVAPSVVTTAVYEPVVYSLYGSSPRLSPLLVHPTVSNGFLRHV